MTDTHNRFLGNHALSPETLMMGYGYDPFLSERSLKPPVFHTSTFVFRSAQGKDVAAAPICRSPSRSAWVIDRLLKNQNPLSPRVRRLRDIRPFNSWPPVHCSPASMAQPPRKVPPGRLLRTRAQPHRLDL